MRSAACVENSMMCLPSYVGSRRCFWLLKTSFVVAFRFEIPLLFVNLLVLVVIASFL